MFLDIIELMEVFLDIVELMEVFLDIVELTGLAIMPGVNNI